MLNNKSLRQRGTLAYIKNLIKKTALPQDPKKNMKVAVDFFLKVLTSYVIVAAKEIIREMNGGTIPDVHTLATEVVDRYVSILCAPSHSDTTDQVLTYSSEILSLGLLWHNFHDAVQEGDGKRVLLVWKFMLIVFKVSRRTNYSKEAAIFLAQYYSLFSKRQAEELLYSRFVNTHGRTGCNIPCDPHIEHLNRRLKGILRNLRSNIQTSCITRAATSLGVVDIVCRQFEKETAKVKTSDHHGIPSMDKELKLIIEALEESPSVFSVTPNRSNKPFTFKESLLQKFQKDDLLDWIVKTVGKHILCNEL